VQFQRDAALRQADAIVERAHEVAGILVIATTVDAPDDKVLREMGEMVQSKLDRAGVVVLASNAGERIGIQVNIDPVLTKRGLNAGKLAGSVGELLGGKGGGRPEVAQGGGKNKAALGAALDFVPKFVKDNIKA